MPGAPVQSGSLHIHETQTTGIEKPAGLNAPGGDCGGRNLATPTVFHVHGQSERDARPRAWRAQIIRRSADLEVDHIHGVIVISLKQRADTVHAFIKCERQVRRCRTARHS